MFKDGKTAKKAMLLAGVGSTMPMRLSAVNQGWKPVQTHNDIPIVNSLIAPMVQTDGPTYAQKETDKPS